VLNVVDFEGLSATVTQSGFCSDGCFETSFMKTSSGQMKKEGLFPYKALMDNSHFLDTKNNKLWVQVQSTKMVNDKVRPPTR
jgi:hypothetical protein